MKPFPRYATALAAVLILSGVVAGAARAHGPMGGFGGEGRGPMPMHAMCGETDRDIAAHAAYLDVKLGLTEAQKTELKALTEAMKAAREPMKQACADMVKDGPKGGPKGPMMAQDDGGPKPLTPPERMQRMQRMLEAQAASMAKVTPAMTRFYDSLTAEQKGLLDPMMAGGPGHHRGWN